MGKLMWKNFCSVVLFLALIFAQGMCGTAWAANHTWNNYRPPVVSDGDTVIISDTPRGTLVVPAGATISVAGTASRDVLSALHFEVPADATVVWSATFTGNAGSMSALVTGGTSEGTFYIAGGKIEVTGGGDWSGRGGTAVNGFHNVIVNGGTVNGATGIAISSFGNITVNDGTINSTRSTAINNNGRGNITVNGGTISSTSSAAITNNSGNVTVNGGTISSEEGSAINNQNGEVIINGGAITGGHNTITAQNIKVNNGEINAAEGSAIFGSRSVTVNGGTISGGGRTSLGEASAISSPYDITISAGTINSRTKEAVRARGEVYISGNATINIIPQ